MSRLKVLCQLSRVGLDGVVAGSRSGHVRGQRSGQCVSVVAASTRVMQTTAERRNYCFIKVSLGLCERLI